MRTPRLTGSVLLAGTVAVVLTCVLVGAAASRAGVRSRSGTIAFLRGANDLSSFSLFAIEADGSGVRRLTPSTSAIDSFEWSPDGRRIAYLDSRGALWVVRPDGAGRKLLAARSPRRMPWELGWSPDGQAIAVLAEDPAAGRPTPAFRHLRITVIPSDGGKPRRLRTSDAGIGRSAGDVGWFAWSARGDEIAYGLNGRVWAIRGDGSDRHPLHLYNVGGGTWSPDGRHLGFGGCRRAPRGRCVGRYAGIYVADADGRNLHLVTGHAYNEYGFAWSPDGRNILYGRANREGIYIIGADGRNNHRLTRDSPRPVFFEALTWSPDGRSIAYATDRTGNGDIYAIGADGHNKVRLTDTGASDIDPSWQPRAER
jgi:Tol biopolymer transport system component